MNPSLARRGNRVALRAGLWYFASVTTKRSGYYKKRLIYLLRIGGSILVRVLETYILDKFESSEIQNDLGASFTDLKRDRRRIVKRAQERGEQKLVDEILWYRRFERSALKPHLPKIYDSSVEPGNVFYEMKYYNRPNLRKIIVDEMNARFFIKLRFKRFGNLGYRADFTEAQLFLTMVPLHLKLKSEGLLCLVTGTIRLNEWFGANHPDIYAELKRRHMEGTP